MTLTHLFLLMICSTVVMITAYAMMVQAWTSEQSGAVGAAVIGLLASMEV